MTGLDPRADTILEIAVQITGAALDPVAPPLCIAIHHPPRVLARMDRWNTAHHTASGLVGRVASSRVSLAQAESAALRLVRAWCTKHTAPLCGNSVWVDRMFLVHHMPRLNAFLHYRTIDVSTLKELAKRWRPRMKPFKKAKRHLAASDIAESIAELEYYRQAFFACR